ncbi:MAG: hypothetical protein J6P61_01225 [Erysipelotrichaceae bacterium]|nr:hypothetical protein [Erysipelotrichaceae bacterium]
MDTKKIKYWTCPTCNAKNPMGATRCKVCGYDAMDDYTQEEIDDMNKSLVETVKEMKPVQRGIMFFEIFAILVVVAYILYKVNQILHKVNKFVDPFI